MFLENTASLRAKRDVAKTRAGLTDTADLCSTHPLISGTDSLQGRMVEPSSTARAVNAPSMPVNAGRLKQLLAQTQLVASVQDPYRSVDSAQWQGQTCVNSLPSHLAEVVGSRHACGLALASECFSRSVRFGELVRAEELSSFLNRADNSVISNEEVSKTLGWKV